MCGGVRGGEVCERERKRDGERGVCERERETNREIERDILRNT